MSAKITTEGTSVGEMFLRTKLRQKTEDDSNLSSLCLKRRVDGTWLPRVQAPVTVDAHNHPQMTVSSDKPHNESRDLIVESSGINRARIAERSSNPQLQRSIKTASFHPPRTFVGPRSAEFRSLRVGVSSPAAIDARGPVRVADCCPLKNPSAICTGGRRRPVPMTD